MSNTLLTTSLILNDGLDILENTLVFGDKCYRQYSDEFGKTGAKIGATVNIRRPARYIGTFGPALNVEDTNQTYLPVSLNYQFHVDVQFTTADLLLNLGDFRDNVGTPMVATIANRIDADGLNFAYQNTAASFGTPGVAPISFRQFSDARALLAMEGLPKNSPVDCILDPLSMSSMADALKGLYNPQANIDSLYKTGLVAKKTAGLDWYEDQNVPAWTTGAQGGTPLLTANTGGAFLTSGWAQSGFIQTNGWTASTGVVKVGDVIQIAGVFPVNPQSRQQYSRSLRQFVVLPPAGYAQMNGAATPGLAFAPATLTSGTFNAVTGVYTSGSGGGALSINIGDAVITGGQFQNCVTTSAFTSTAALTVNGGTANAGQVSPQGIIMHKNAFALAFADLPMPKNQVDAARIGSKSANMSVRMVTAYTINNDAEPTRMDVLYGYSGLYRSMAVRAAG